MSTPTGTSMPCFCGWARALPAKVGWRNGTSSTRCRWRICAKPSGKSARPTKLFSTAEGLGFLKEALNRQDAPFSRVETGEIEIAEAAAMEREHLVALAGEHALYLVVLAFREFELSRARAYNLQLGRSAWLIFAMQQQCA